MIKSPDFVQEGQSVENLSAKRFRFSLIPSIARDREKK